MEQHAFKFELGDSVFIGINEKRKVGIVVSMMSPAGGGENRYNVEVSPTFASGATPDETWWAESALEPFSHSSGPRDDDPRFTCKFSMYQHVVLNASGEAGYVVGRSLMPRYLKRLCYLVRFRSGDVWIDEIRLGTDRSASIKSTTVHDTPVTTINWETKLHTPIKATLHWELLGGTIDVVVEAHDPISIAAACQELINAVQSK